MTSQVQAQTEPNHGRVILVYFILFFATIVVVNSFFIYMALDSFTGTVTENPYKKGLAYDEIISKAKSQPDMNDIVSYQDGFLKWKLLDKQGQYIENAKVTAYMVRPVKDGYDFNIDMQYIGNGEYEAKLDLPLKGSWQAHLKAIWNTEEYQTSYSFLAE